ncbi:MAG: NAD(P)-dependent glycerol-3-phosphate dehydrogenase [Candidatus Omnitrophica bacterium]|nr:NAD(P)-dependent glycerol-3-phosphate dehydrogenase [Candidatus Omnitrophota bacterium]
MRASTHRHIVVLGDGGWGTTLAIHSYRLGHRVTLWGAFADYVRVLDHRRQNPRFLPGIRIPARIRITADLAEAWAGADLAILAVPSQYLRAVVRRVARLPRSTSRIVSVAKGIERGSLKLMSTVITEELGAVKLAILSGPNISSEIAKGQPASSVVAARDLHVAHEVQRALMSETFRLYTSRDLLGVQLGGALKNPIAIAAGIADGLGFGSNAKAALVTRGIVEMARLGVAMGAKEDTFWGLSGLGDLVTTCLSGRNHWLGEQLGRGRSLAYVLRSTPMVIEGVETAKAAVVLGRRHRVELPIIEQVHAILFHRRVPRHALRALMRRAGKSETGSSVPSVSM